MAARFPEVPVEATPGRARNPIDEEAAEEEC
jgi:hypothetical protein